MPTRTCFFSAILLSSLVARLDAQRDGRHETYGGLTVPSDAILPAREVHPSLWFSASTLPSVLARKDGDALAARLWAQIETSPHLTMPMPPAPAIDDGKKVIHRYYGDMSRIAFYCGFMSVADSVPARRVLYGRRAIAALERAFDGPVYALDPKKKSSPVDEIYRGVWAQNYAAAYDCVFEQLSATENEKIRSRLKTEAVYLHENIDRLTPKRPHNHLSKPAWGLASLALTLSSEREAKAWLAHAIEAANRTTKFYFSADGIYREGSHYYIFSLINLVPFLYHYRNVSGVDAFESFKPAFEWPVLMRDGKGMMPNHEDSYLKPFPSHMVAAAFRGSRTRLHTKASLAQVLMWSHANTDWSLFDRAEAKRGFNYSGASWDYAKPLVEYLCYEPGIEAVAPDVSPTVFLASGQTAFRNRWSAKDPASRMLLFQGVNEADNHEHDEHLSFTIQAENQMMASDAGYSRKSYGESIRKSWYKTAEAHNVVMVDGKGPVDPGMNETPASRYRLDTSYFDFEEKEAPYAGGGRLKRAIGFPHENYFVIVDDVRIPKKATITAVLHGGRGAMSGKGVHRSWGYESDDYGPKARMHAWLLSDGAELEDKSGELTYIKGDWAEFPYVTAAKRARRASFMQIVYPNSANGAVPRFEELSESGVLAATLTRGPVTDLFAHRTEPAPVRIRGVESDASFVCVSIEDAEVRWWFAREASYLSFERRMLWNAPARQTVSASRASNGKFEVTRVE